MQTKTRIVFRSAMLCLTIQFLNTAAGQRSPETITYELFLTVEPTDAAIRVTSDYPDVGGSLPDVVVYDDDVKNDFDWAADTNCGQTATGRNIVDFDCNKLYTITFAVVGGDVEFEFQWMTCQTNYGYQTATHGFYCLSDNPSGENNRADLEIVYTSQGAFKVRPLDISTPTGKTEYITDYFTSPVDWVWPHDRVAYCGTDTDCLKDASRVNYFISPQVSDSTHYVLSASEFRVPSTGDGYAYTETWTWNNKTIDFASGAELIVKGEFNADGLTLGTQSGSWDGIRFDSGSSGTIESSEITGVSSAYGAIRVFGTSVTIDDVVLKNPSAANGIYVSGSGAFAVIHDTSIEGNDNGVTFTSSAGGQMWRDTLAVNHAAVAAYYYASPYLRSYPDHSAGSNELGGNDNGVIAGNSATVYAGSDTYAGSNQFCPSAAYEDAWAFSSASIEARRNYWPAGSPDVSGTVDTANVLGSSSCVGIARKGSGTLSPFAAIPDITFDERLSIAVDDMHRAAAGPAVETGVALAEVAKRLKEIRADSPGLEPADAALVALFELARLQRNQDQRKYFEDLAWQSGPDQATALGILIQAYQFWGEQSRARETAQTLAKLYPDQWHAFYAGLSLFDMALASSDYGAANEALLLLAARDKIESGRLAAAWSELTRRSQGAFMRPADPRTRLEAATGSSESIIGVAAAYPNPFNPTTTVTFRLDTGASTSVRVFDSVGRQVATLADSWREPGMHAAAWNAASLSTGTYFVVIRAGRSATVLPLVLTK